MKRNFEFRHLGNLWKFKTCVRRWENRAPNPGEHSWAANVGVSFGQTPQAATALRQRRLVDILIESEMLRFNYSKRTLCPLPGHSTRVLALPWLSRPVLNEWPG